MAQGWCGVNKFYSPGDTSLEGPGQGPVGGEGAGWRDWWQATRPPFFIATIAPLSLGFVAAIKYTGQNRWGLFLLILLASFVVHLATNLANDLFDYWQGVDDGPNIGGSRVIQEGKIAPKTMAVVLVCLYVLGLGGAIIIINLSGQPYLWGLVIFAALSSFFYVAPPIKYGHRALGELFVFINMGLIMTAGVFLAVAGSFDLRVLALALPVSFMVSGILYYQSLPEIDSDKEAGKKTLANVLGRDKASFLYLLWWPLVWLLMIFLYLAGLSAWPILLGLATCPLHVAVVRRIREAGEGDWLPLDAYGHLVRKLYLINSLLLIVGVALV